MGRYIMKVYHYTDQESFELINKMKKMLPSTQNTTRDAYGGDGWYFTDLIGHQINI